MRIKIIQNKEMALDPPPIPAMVSDFSKTVRRSRLSAQVAVILIDQPRTGGGLTRFLGLLKLR